MSVLSREDIKYFIRTPVGRLKQVQRFLLSHSCVQVDIS